MCVCLWAPAVRRPLSPGLDMSPIRPAVSPSVTHTHSTDPARAQGELSVISHTSIPSLCLSLSVSCTRTLIFQWYGPSGTVVVLLSLIHILCVCVRETINTSVAAGHGKSSVLPLIVLITSLGAASPHTYWPLLLLWNHALLTRRWWCHRAQGGMMGEEKRRDQVCLIWSFPKSKSQYNKKKKVMFMFVSILLQKHYIWHNPGIYMWQAGQYVGIYPHLYSSPAIPPLNSAVTSIFIVSLDIRFVSPRALNYTSTSRCLQGKERAAELG